MVPRARTAHMLANSIRCMSACASQAGRQGEPESLGSSVVVERMEREALGSLSGSLDQIEFVSIDPGRSIAAQVRGVDINPRADRRRTLYGIKVGDEIPLRPCNGPAICEQRGYRCAESGGVQGMDVGATWLMLGYRRKGCGGLRRLVAREPASRPGPLLHP